MKAWVAASDMVSATEYWSNRFCTYGHTGDSDDVLYRYDQALRVKLVRTALRRLDIILGPKTPVLDVGCGTGDFINLYIRLGAQRITAVDIVEDVLIAIRNRFSARSSYLSTALGMIEDMTFPAESFQLVSSINVLQHITDDSRFFRALDVLSESTRRGGYIFVMEFAQRQRMTTANGQLSIRSREYYIKHFRNRDCVVTAVYGFPQIGVRVYRTLLGTMASLRRSRLSETVNRNSTSRPAAGGGQHKLSHVLKRAILSTAFPLDNLLVNRPRGFGNMTLFVFRRSTQTNQNRVDVTSVLPDEKENVN